VDLLRVHEELALPGHVAPDEDDLVFAAAAFFLGETTGNGGGGREAELEGDATLGSRNAFPGAFGPVIDLVRRVEAEVVEGSSAGRIHDFYLVCGCVLESGKREGGQQEVLIIFYLYE